MSGIRKAGVDYVDLRREIFDNNLDHKDLFFVTDHHWTPEAGFWGAGVVANILNEKYGFSIDASLYDLSNYNIKIKEKWFLGTEGKRVGSIFAGVDDLHLLTPKFRTDLVLSIPSKVILKKGDFENTIFDMSHVDEKAYYEKNPYCAYMGGDFPLSIIKNNLVNGKKILLVRDSFACVFAPFISLGCRELEIIDLRHYNDKSLYKYIESSSPDLVMFLYNPIEFYKDEMFEFGSLLHSSSSPTPAQTSFR